MFQLNGGSWQCGRRRFALEPGLNLPMRYGSEHVRSFSDSLGFDGLVDSNPVEQIAAVLQENPLIGSEALATGLDIPIEELIGYYDEIRKTLAIQRSWKASKNTSFFTIASQLMAVPDRLEQIICGEFTFPLFVEFHSAGLCPLDCSFCYNRKADSLRDLGQRRAMLTAAEFTEVVDEIAANGSVILNIAGGGEPLNDPVVLENMTYARHKGLVVTLNTMGAHLRNPSIQAKVLELNQIRVSLNAATAETYERLAGPGRGPMFTYVTSALKHLVYLRNRSRVPLVIVTSFIVVPDNFGELETGVELVAQMGVDSVFVRPDYVGISRPFLAREVRELRAAVSRLKSAISSGVFGSTKVSIADAFEHDEFGVAAGRFVDLFSSGPCWSSAFKVGVDAWGNVHRCALVAQPGVGGFRHTLGDLRGSGSLLAVLRTQPFPRPPVDDCLREGIACNVFEGYLNAFFSKLCADSAFGVPVARQPFAADPSSPYEPARTGQTDAAARSMSLLKSSSFSRFFATWLLRFPAADCAATQEEIAELLGELRFKIGSLSGRSSSLPRVAALLAEMNHAFNTAYATLAVPPPTARKKAELFAPYVVGPHVIDLGCGWNILGPALLRETSGLEGIMGLDVECQNRGSDCAGVSFQLMEHPLVIPLPSAVASTVILSFVLHHLQVDTSQFLSEVSRILAIRGRVLVLEDTFPSDGITHESDDLTCGFMELSSDEERFSFLRLADWFVHQYVNCSRTIATEAKNHRSMGDWRRVFDAAGFRTLEERYLGFASLGSRNPVSRGFFVLEKRNGPCQNSIR